MSATVVLTVDNKDGGDTEFTMDTGDDIVSFQVEITNPCLSTDILAVVFETLTVVDGETGTVEWSDPGTQLDEDNADTDLCGPVSFEVYLDTSDTEFTPTYVAKWAEIT